MTSLRAALVVQKCIAGNFNKNLDSTLNFIHEAHENKADIVVFPEMNLTGYVSNKNITDICRKIDGDLVKALTEASSSMNITVLAGIAERSSTGGIYASHLVFSPSGEYGKYRKIHTSPFEKKYFSSGEELNMFTCSGFNFGIQLCYDSHFPELSTVMALKGADIIFIPHASPRGTSREKFDSWSRHLTARAFDNSVYVAACNQTGDNSCGLSFPGISLLISPDGNIVHKSLEPGEGLHMVSLKKSALDHIRSHKMRYFLPNRRDDLFGM